jgi:hypothetical protein
MANRIQQASFCVNGEMFAANGAPSPNDVMPMIPLTIVNGSVRLNYFSMITTVGIPQTVTAEELRLECMFPADDATETGHGRFILAHSARRSAHQ